MLCSIFIARSDRYLDIFKKKVLDMSTFSGIRQICLVPELAMSMLLHHQMVPMATKIILLP